MPFVDEDLSEGLRLSQDENGVYHLTRVFFCGDLTGSNPLDIFSQPLVLIAGGVSHTGGDIPLRFGLITVRGINLWCKTRNIEPFPPNDAVLVANYDSVQPPVAGFGPVIKEVGATLEQGETVFDAANMNLAWASRAVIKVDPPTSHAGEEPQFPAVPVLVPKPSLNFTADTTDDPEALSDRFVGKKNGATWKGHAAGIVMCLSITGRNKGDGIWNTSFQFAKDATGKFFQVARWKTADGLFPALTPTDITTRKGIQDVDVQDTDDFSVLPI